MTKIFEYTATGRYFKVYIDGVYVSQHSDEREAIEKSNEILFDNYNADVKYIHEYEVQVALTDAGITEAKAYASNPDTPPVITSTPGPSFSEGTGGTYNFAAHVQDDGFSVLTYSLSNVLPNGLSLNSSTGVLTYDGLAADTTSQHQLTATDAVGSDTSSVFNIVVNEVVVGGGDWSSRSTAPGVVMATNFDTLAEVEDYTFSVPGQVNWEQTVKASGNGCLKFDVLKTDGESSGSWRRYLADSQRTFDTGEAFYVQYRMYFPAYYATHPFLNGGGWKQSIISHFPNSNTLFEVVLQNTSHRGYPGPGYNRNTTGAFLDWSDDVSTNETASDKIRQNQIGRGYGTATYLDERRTYGGLFSETVTGYGAGTGIPDPETGAFIYYPDEWLTFLQKITPGTFGGGDTLKDSRIEVWAARNGATDYTKLTDKMVNLGDEGSGERFDAIWLLPFNTSRTADATREDTYVLYDELIVSTNPIAVPATTIPTWADNAVGSITAIGENTMNDVVAPDIVGKGHVGSAREMMANFSGGTVAYRRGAPYLYVFGSGHTNSVNTIAEFGPLTGEKPQWRIRESASDISDIVDLAAYTLDLKQNALHTYNDIAAQEKDHYFWLTPFEGPYDSGGQGSGKPNLDRYDVDIGEWDGEAVHPNITTTGADQNGAAVYHDGKLYWRGANGFFGDLEVFTESSNTWANRNNQDVFFLGHCSMAYDSARDRMFAFSTNKYQYWDVGTLTPVSASIAAVPDNSAKAIEYDATRDKYVLPGRGNQNMYELDPVSFTWSTRTFTGATPDAGHPENNGVHGRFRYLDVLDGYIHAPSHDGSVYFWRSS